MMKEKALQLRAIVDTACGEYYIFKDEDVLTKAKAAAGQIQDYCSFFLQGNVFGMEEGEYQNLYCYVLQVVEDYVEAVEQEDMVLMLDTLDYGLRELLGIYLDNKDGAENELF